MKTTDEIYAQMCQTYKAASGSDVGSGGDMSVRLYAAAAQIYSLYAYADWVKRQSFPQTASGESLDNHAEMRGLKRNDAVAAEGEIRFLLASAMPADIAVPKGTVCMTADEVSFETAEDAVIPAGEVYCDVKARAVNPGALGNAGADTVIFMTSPPIGILACTNMSEFKGGKDGEDDESLRSRVLSSFSALPNGANAAYYKKEALGIEGVSAVNVLPKPRGTGTVDVIISAETGLPSQELMDKVREHLNQRREISVDLQVLAPQPVTVDIDIKIDIEDGYAFSAVEDDLRAAIGGCFNGGALGRDVILAQLGSIAYSVKGVKNYRFLQPEEDISVLSTQLPVLGSLTVGQWS